jgi:hypothetical protein
VTVAGSGGTSPYTYAKDGTTFVSSGTFGSLAAGNYTITVQDFNGCITMQPVTITQPSSAVGASITSQTNVKCFGDSTGSVTVAGSGGTSPYTYAKDGTTFGSSGTFGGLAAGSYTITVQDDNGCITTQPVTITQPTSALTLSLQKTCSNGNDGSITATASGGTGTLIYSKDGTNFQTSNMFTGLAAGNYTITVQDDNLCTKTAPITVNTCVCNPPGACTPPYPFTSMNSRTNIAFSESEVLRKFGISVGANCTPSTIQVFYNDEHALTLGIRQVIVKTSKSSSTTTNYPVTPLTANPGSAIQPSVGDMIAAGDQAGVDLSGRPIFPALFITDISPPNDPNSLAGDWQYGGTAIPPDAVFGTWKAAVKTVDKSKGTVITVTPDADPAQNNWNLGPGSDPVPAGLVNEGYGAEVRWDISNLHLTSGRTYRVYVMVHDGDQNKAGGDSGQACATITMPSSQ